MKTLAPHIPDLICRYRIYASVAALCFGPHPITTWLFATALISDLFDGWFYRRYVHHQNPAKGPSLDCFSDLVLVITGSIFILKYYFHAAGISIFLCVLAIIAGAALLFFIPEIFRSATLYTICLTTLTHIACFLMLLPTIFACYLAPGRLSWPVEAALFLAAFYVIFALIGDKSRLIRRPPANWHAKH